MPIGSFVMLEISYKQGSMAIAKIRQTFHNAGFPFGAFAT
jgi:hypothetical protein